MAGGGAARAERRRESARESAPGGGENGEGGGAVHRGGGGRGAGEPRMPSTRRRRPDTVGRARRGRVRARREEAWTRRGLASLAGPVGWCRPASEQPLLSFFQLFFPNPFLNPFELFRNHFHLFLPEQKLF